MGETIYIVTKRYAVSYHTPIEPVLASGSSL